MAPAPASDPAGDSRAAGAVEPKPERESESTAAPHTPAADVAPAAPSDTASPRPPSTAGAPAASAPQSTLRITEIPAQNPNAWVDALQGELDRCAQLGFFERPDCAWAARKQFCEPNHGWGSIQECPAQP